MTTYLLAFVDVLLVFGFALCLTPVDPPGTADVRAAVRGWLYSVVRCGG